MTGIILNQIQHNEHLANDIVFVLNPSQPLIYPDCVILPIVEATRFDGTLIATDIDTAHYMRHCKAKKKVFYLRDLEWTKKNDFYENIEMHYTNPDFEYWANSTLVKEAFEKYWGTKITKVIEEINGLPNA